MRNISKDTRMSHKLTQEAFAERLDVTRQTIIRWERDPENVPLGAIVRILALDTELAV